MFARSTELERAGDGNWLNGVFLDGSLLVSGAVEASPPANATIYVNRFALYSYDANGSLRDTIGIFPGGGIYRTDRLHAPLPFNLSGTLGYGVDGQEVVVGIPWDREIRRHTDAGDLLRIIRTAEPVSLVGSDTLRSRFEDRLERTDASARDRVVLQMEEALKAVSSPIERPDFGRFLLDAGGNVWLQEWRWPGAAPGSWTVHSSEGQPLARVAMPEGLIIREIGADYVLGTVEDDLGVQRVRVYSLERRD